MSYTPGTVASPSSMDNQKKKLTWSNDVHKTISKKIDDYGYHIDHDYRCQALRDIVDIITTYKGIYPTDSQKLLADHLVRSIRDSHTDVNSFACSNVITFLLHLSDDIITSIILHELIILYIDPQRAVPPRAGAVNNDGSKPSYTHPLYIKAIKDVVSFITTRNATLSNPSDDNNNNNTNINMANNNRNQILTEKVYNALIPKLIEFVSINDQYNPDDAKSEDISKSPKIPLKKSVFDIIPLLSSCLSKEISLKMTNEQSKLFFDGFLSSLHHQYQPIAKAASESFGSILAMFPIAMQIELVGEFLNKLNNDTLVPKIQFPKNFDELHSNQSYTPGSNTLSLTQLYVLALTTFPRVMNSNILSSHLDKITLSLIHSLPTIILTTRVFKPNEITNQIDIDTTAVNDMNKIIGQLSTTEFIYFKSIIISLQKIINFYFSRITTPQQHIINHDVDFNDNANIDKNVDSLLDVNNNNNTATPPPTFLPQLHPDICLFIQAVLPNCLLIDPAFSYPIDTSNDINEDDMGNNNDNNNRSGAMADPDDPFADDEDDPFADDDGDNKANNDDDYDPFADDDDPFADDDDDGAGTSKTTSSSSSTAFALDLGEDYYDYAPTTAVATTTATKSNTVQLLEQLLDESSTIRSTALTMMVQFNTSTLMSLRQYCNIDKDGALKVNILENTPLSILLLTNPLWISTIQFALREHEPAQLSVLLQTLPLFLTTISYINTILISKNNNNPLTKHVSPNFIDIANTMIAHVKSGLEVEIVNNNIDVIIGNGKQTVLVNNQHAFNILQLWSQFTPNQLIPSDLLPSIEKTVTDTTTVQNPNIYHNEQIGTTTSLTTLSYSNIVYTPQFHIKQCISTLTALTKRITLILPSVLISDNNSITEHSDLLTSLLRTILSITTLFNDIHDQLQPSIRFNGDLRFFMMDGNNNDEQQQKQNILQLKQVFNTFLISIMAHLLQFMTLSTRNNNNINNTIWSLFAFLYKNTTSTTLFNTQIPTKIIKLLNSSYSDKTTPTCALFTMTVLNIIRQWYTNATTTTPIVHFIAHIYQHTLLTIATTAPFNDIIRDQMNNAFILVSNTMMAAYTTTHLQASQMYNLSILHHLSTILPTNYFPSVSTLLSPSTTFNQQNDVVNHNYLVKFTILYTFVLSHSFYIFSQLNNILRLSNNDIITWSTIGDGNQEKDAKFLSSMLQKDNDGQNTKNTKLVQKRDRQNDPTIPPPFMIMPSWIDGIPGVYSKNYYQYKDLIQPQTWTNCVSKYKLTHEQGKYVKKTYSKTKTNNADDTDMSDGDEEISSNIQSTIDEEGSSNNNGDDCNNDIEYYGSRLHNINKNINSLPSINVIQFVFDTFKLINIASTTICPHMFKLALLFTSTNADGYITDIIYSLKLISLPQTLFKTIFVSLKQSILTSLMYLTLPYEQTSPQELLPQPTNQTNADLLMRGLQFYCNSYTTLTLPPLQLDDAIASTLTQSSCKERLIDPSVLISLQPQLCQLVYIDKLLTPSFFSLLTLIHTAFLTFLQTQSYATNAQILTDKSTTAMRCSSPSAQPFSHKIPISSAQLPIYLAILFNISTYIRPNVFNPSLSQIKDILTITTAIFFYGLSPTQLPSSIMITLLSLTMNKFTSVLAQLSTNTTNPLDLIDDAGFYNNNINVACPSHQINNFFTQTTNFGSTIAQNGTHNELHLPLYQKIAMFLLGTGDVNIDLESNKLVLNLFTSLSTILDIFSKATDINTVDFTPHLLPHLSRCAKHSHNGDENIHIHGMHLLHLTLSSFTIFPTHVYASLQYDSTVSTQIINCIKILTQEIIKTSSPSPLLVKLTTAFIHLCTFLPGDNLSATASAPILDYILTSINSNMNTLSALALGDQSYNNIKLLGNLYTVAISMTLSTYSYLNTTLPNAQYKNTIYTKVPFYIKLVQPLQDTQGVIKHNDNLLLQLFTLLMKTYAGYVKTELSQPAAVNRRIDEISTDLGNFDPLSTQIIFLISPQMYTAFVSHCIEQLQSTDEIVSYQSWSVLSSLARGLTNAINIYDSFFALLSNQNINNVLQSKTIRNVLFTQSVTSRMSTFVTQLFNPINKFTRQNDQGQMGLFKLTLKNELILLYTQVLRLEAKSSSITPSNTNVNESVTLNEKNIDQVNDFIHTDDVNNYHRFFTITSLLPQNYSLYFAININTYLLPIKPSTQANSYVYIDLQHHYNMVNTLTTLSASMNAKLTTSSTPTSSFKLYSSLITPSIYDYRSQPLSTSPPSLELYLRNISRVSIDLPYYLAPLRLDDVSSSGSGDNTNGRDFSEVITAFTTNMLSALTSTSTPITMLSFYEVMLSSSSLSSQRYNLTLLLSEMVIRKNYVVKAEQGKMIKYFDDCLRLRKNALLLFQLLLSPSVNRGLTCLLSLPNTNLNNNKYAQPIISAFFNALIDFDIVHSSEIRSLWLSIIETIITQQYISTISYMPTTLQSFMMQTEAIQASIVKQLMSPVNNNSMTDSNDNTPATPGTNTPTTNNNNTDIQNDDNTNTAQNKDPVRQANLNPTPILASNDNNYNNNNITSSQGNTSSESTPITLLQPLLNDSTIDQGLFLVYFSHLFASKIKQHLLSVFKVEPCLNQTLTLVQLNYYAVNAPLTDQVFVMDNWSIKTQQQKDADKQTNDNINVTRLWEQTILKTAKTKELYEKVVVPMISE